MSKQDPSHKKIRGGRRGRPTLLTPQLQEQIVGALKAGNYIETAAAYAGVSKVSLYEWMRRGNKEATGIHRDFLNAVSKAVASSEVRDVALIAKAANTQWQAAAWRLERKHPDRWGRKDRIEHTGEGGGPVRIRADKLSDAELEILERTLASAAQDGQQADGQRALAADAGGGLSGALEAEPDEVVPED